MGAARGNDRMNMPLRAFASIGLAALAAFVAGGQAAAQGKPWRHGVIEPKSDAGFLLMATTNGFAQKHGITLQITSLKNEMLGLRAILSGDLDSYEGAPPVAAIARGADVKEIGCPWATVPHLIFARTGIDSVKDLAGKSMATSSPSSMPDLVGRMAIEQAGLAPDSVKLANVGSDADRYRSLIGGVVDAAVISSEYQPIVDMQKVHVLRKASDIVPDFVRTCYQATAKTLADRPDDVARFLATEMEALRFALGHKDETIRLTREQTGQKPDDPRAAFMFDEVQRTNQIDPTLPIPAEKLASMQRTLVKLGITPKAIDVGAMIDARPRERALAMTVTQ
jgi:NitT/TauT family transport system substrate-binding protein